MPCLSSLDMVEHLPEYQMMRGKGGEWLNIASTSML